MNRSTFSANASLEALCELLGAATHDASTAMSRWTNGLITLTLDEVREIPLGEVYSELKMEDDLLTMVVLALDGEIGGQMILTFDERNGRQLAGRLLNRPAETDGDWTPLERSALCETGNILGCAYMNALTRLTGVELVPSPPYFIQDYGASVLDQALAMQAATSDHALICRTGFHRKGENLDWHVFFTPTQGMRDRIERALGASV